MSRTDDLARRLADITALDLEGESTRLGSFWEDRPTVLVFVRHFG